MTTTFYLIRHGSHGLSRDILVGRMENVRLAPHGRAEARRLARRFAGRALCILQSSPRERALETAEAIAQLAGLPMEIASELDEVDVGEWTGWGFAALSADPRWARWNSRRERARAPGGESMRQVQRRVIRHLDRLRVRCPDGRVAIVSHAEIIRTAVLYHLGLSLDAFARIEISAPSITTLAVGDWGAKVLTLNETATA